MTVWGEHSSSTGLSVAPSVFLTGGATGLAGVSCLTAWMAEALKKEEGVHK